MTLHLKSGAIALALAAIGGGALATDLPSESITSSVGFNSFFGGTLLDSAVTFISNSSYNGIARTAVYDTGSGLDFYYQFSNDISSKNGIERFSAYDFSSVGSGTVLQVYQTNQAFGIFSTGTESSDYADRSNLGVIGFSFVPNGLSKINPGTTSFTQIIRTSARSYVPGSFGLLDGIGDNAAGFAPSAVPEPQTYLLMLAGMGVIGYIARRRRSDQAG
ncbi:PEP-CTERM sorting domain-containing protein [Paucibacter sp. APW11]|uniref:PEP-CTERM sorting domain-containing protein n=1 Tax=Roseateles aquae TaxID=3077235 RepID=A0ABU3PIR4_9BURK|nr:PEP-CTERM sorting domain-containing protein [Paucibacter sp. APW11]MDT9002455.1 PEP-CTERM sorting domain-containing protein [Paucibacter sp. APW11]